MHSGAGSPEKKPFKFVEIPLNNFNEIVLPHHRKLLTEYKEDYSKAKDEKSRIAFLLAKIKRSCSQFRDLLYELETLRAQVETADLHKFDMASMPIRKTMTQYMSEYSDLIKKVEAVSASNTYDEQSNEEESEQNEPLQLRIDADINELKIKDKESRLHGVEAIQNEIEDIHVMYDTLHGMVADQAENVNIVENNVEEVQENVSAGARHLFRSTRLRASVYPVAGALVGACVVGPIGLLAGLKVGGLAALSCGLLGYTGGNILKKNVLDTDSSPEVESTIGTASTTNKKDD